MQVIKLKNGSTELEPLIQATMLNINTLVEKDPLAIIDLVLKARDNSYQFFGDAEATLQRMGLIQKGGRIHQSIKNIVLSAAEGEGLDISIGNPVENNEPTEGQE